MKKSLFFLTFFLLFSSGCVLVPFAGAIISSVETGVVTWYGGLAHKYYNEESLILYRATKMALRDLDHVITTDESSKDGYRIIAGNKDRFKIFIRRVKPHISEIQIRVNLLGDKPYAELIYNQIDLNTSSIEFDPQGRPTKNKRIQELSQ